MHTCIHIYKKHAINMRNLKKKIFFRIYFHKCKH